MLILLVYLAAIVGAEIAAAVTNPRLGLGAHALILGALLLHAALAAPGRPRAMVLAIALVPILRMVSLALPLVGLPLVWWYALITVIAAVAVAIAARAAGFSSRELGLEAPRRSLPLALLMVPLGLGLGLLEYMILRPQPWVRSPALAELWLPALLLIIGSGLMELVFRGLLQAAAVALLGRAGGIAYVAVLFTGLYAGYFWWAVLLFILPVALLLGVLAWRSRSILPSTLAHAAMNVMVFLIAPLVLPNPPTLGALRLPSVAELRPPVLLRVPSVMAATAAQPVVATPTPTGPRLPGGPADAAPSDGRPVGGPFGPISPRVGPTPLPTPPTPPPATPQPTPIPPATSTPIPTSTPTEVPPSPTSTPTSTAVGQPTATSPTPEATPTPAVATATPTPEPSPQPPATPVIADATPTPTTLVATPTASTPTAMPEVGNGRHENGAGQAGLPRSGAGGVELPTLVVRGTEGIGARLRSSPGLDAPILSLLEESAIVTVAGPDQLVDDLVWQYVRLADGQEGWIATILLAPESPRAREVR